MNGNHVKGGQGRLPEHVEESARATLAYLGLAVVLILVLRLTQ